MTWTWLVSPWTASGVTTGVIGFDGCEVSPGSLSKLQYCPWVWEGMFPSTNEGSASGGRRAPPEVGCVAGGTSSPGLTSVERSCDIGSPPSNAKCWGCSTVSRESAQRGLGREHKRGLTQAVRGRHVRMLWL
ncbi:hypothetical protein BHE74_00008667 [Ensete ventricosum]|nr:hypothetical protein BHE74_00008667 [Ensete ventricosum]